MAIDKDTLIGALLRQNPDAADKLIKFGMTCVGCPSAQMETIEQAAMVHGLNLDELLKSLNE